MEEARQANRVGMMRFGRLLAEDSPAALIETHNQTNLENVFLSLCLKTGDEEPDGPDQELSEDPTDCEASDTKSQSLPMTDKQVSVVRKNIKFQNIFILRKILVRKCRNIFHFDVSRYQRLGWETLV